MDDDDKVRRNLMVVSFAVLLYFWLELPDQLITKKLLGEDQTHALSAWKVWLTLVVVLCYQLHRFISATLLAPEWEKLTRSFGHRRETLIVASIRAAESGLRTGKLPRWMSYAEPREYGGADFTAVLRDIPSEQRDALRLQGLIDTPRGDDPFFHRVRVLTREGESWKNFNAVYFFVPHRLRWMFDLKVLVSMSKTAYFSEVGIPVLIGYAALLLSVSSTARAVMY